MFELSDPINFIILSFWSLFVIVDPVGAIPTFLAMTARNKTRDRVRMARLASVVTFFVLVLFSFGLLLRRFLKRRLAGLEHVERHF